VFALIAGHDLFCGLTRPSGNEVVAGDFLDLDRLQQIDCAPLIPST
jgi:hypothetical protein